MTNLGDEPLKVRFDGVPGASPVVDAVVEPGASVDVPEAYVVSGAVARLYPSLGTAEAEPSPPKRAESPPAPIAAKEIEALKPKPKPKKKKSKKDA